MSETPYYAKDGKVWKRSVETKHDDGSSSFTLEFPICEATELVGEDGAVSIAGLMNLGEEAQNRPAEDELVTALERLWRQMMSAEFEDIDDDSDLVVITIMAKQARSIRALIAKHGKGGTG